MAGKGSGQRRYLRLDRADRGAIERGLDEGRSARAIARDLGRSPSSVAEEARRNRTVSKGPGRGERVGEPPEGEPRCPRLARWPHVCNGCKHRRYHCGRKWRCEYSAARAQHLADEALSEARKGVDRDERELEDMMAKIRSDVARGLSPAQVVAGRASEFQVHPSTACRWIERGYGGMGNAEPRRKVGYKPRSRAAAPKPTSHGPERSYAAFLELGEEARAGACETGTVIGGRRDAQCVLTLYLRPCRFQVAMLLPSRTTGAVASALGSLERALGHEGLGTMFGLLLTDNGAELSDCGAIESSCLPGRAPRCSACYCDVRASQQKAGCERNHVELRKLLPKRRGISFDELEARDLAVAMSHLNSEPRPSLAGMSPIRMLMAAYGSLGEALMGALGVEEVPYEELLLDVAALDRSRAERGLAPLA